MKKIVFAFLMCCVFRATAQIPIGNPGEVDVAGVEYGIFPELGNTEVNYFGANFNVAKPIGKGVLGLGLRYQNFDFSFDEPTNQLDFSSYERAHAIRLNIFYRLRLKNSWSVLTSLGPSLMSNFESGISSEDFVANAILLLSKRWGDQERNSSLSFGVFYGTQFGEPTIFPALSFRQKLNEKWSYSVGLPATGVSYQINKRNRVSFRAQPQGIFANNSSEVLVNNNLLTNTKLQFNGFGLGLVYRYRLAKSLVVEANGGFLPVSNLKILDTDNEEIYDFDPGSGAYFNIGLRFSPQRTGRPPSSNNSKKQ